MGVVLTFLREVLDVRVRTPEDLRKHGFLPMAMNRADEREERSAGDKTRFGLAGRQSMRDCQRSRIRWLLSPKLSSLRTNILYARVDEPIRTLLVSSPNRLREIHNHS